MTEKYQGIEKLIYRFLTGELSGEERVRLDEWRAQPGNEALFQRVCDKERLLARSLQYDKYDQRTAWQCLERRLWGRHLTVGRRWWWAASLLLPLGVAVWLWMGDEHDSLPVAKVECVEIVPAVTGAHLELASGEVVDLTNGVGEEIVFEEGKLVRENGGVMAYVADSAVEVKYHEVLTPKGCEYQLKLPDGTMVWLNAGSSLRFPSKFVGDCRKVYASGELYFDVERDEEHPFVVETGDGYAVRVLGTEFNLRAYEGEIRATTLLEGRVVVNDGEEDVMLAPGQQAVEGDDGKLEVRKVDTRGVVAWRNGVFLFVNTRLEDIMAEIGRWYDVEVFFENSAIRDERFSVEMQRHDSFETVLRLIERTGTVEISINQNNVFVK